RLFDHIAILSGTSLDATLPARSKTFCIPHDRKIFHHAARRSNFGQADGADRRRRPAGAELDRSDLPAAAPPRCKGLDHQPWLTRRPAFL
ncbi:MAG: hypothetical protein ACREH3_07280, partial [Geminicoccales bacterium]